MEFGTGFGKETDIVSQPLYDNIKELKEILAEDEFARQIIENSHMPGLSPSGSRRFDGPEL